MAAVLILFSRRQAGGFRLMPVYHFGTHHTRLLQADRRPSFNVGRRARRVFPALVCCLMARCHAANQRELHRLRLIMVQAINPIAHPSAASHHAPRRPDFAVP